MFEIAGFSFSRHALGRALDMCSGRSRHLRISFGSSSTFRRVTSTQKWICITGIV
jgi:hypothetical protein